MRALRNVAIIAALAAIVDFAPGGSNAATAILTALLIAFLATLGVAGQQLYRENRMTLQGLPERERAFVYAAVGVIVLMVAAAHRMLLTGTGTLAWVALLSAAIVVIARIWVRANSY
jgi:hypothetical protein